MTHSWEYETRDRARATCRQCGLTKFVRVYSHSRTGAVSTYYRGEKLLGRKAPSCEGETEYKRSRIKPRTAYQHLMEED